MKIRKFRQADRDTWDEYILNHPNGTIFHQYNWKKVIEDSFNHKSVYLLAEEGKKIVGILPLFIIKSMLFGHYLVSIPFAETGGGLADKEGTEKLLCKKAIEIAESNNCDYLELRNKKEVSGYQTKSLYYNFKREIFSDHEQNMLAIPRKSRAMVRKGIKNELTSEMGHHLFNDFYEILALNFHRLGTPIFSKNFLKNFLKNYKENSNILIVRSKEGRIIAGALSFFYKDQVVPYYAGSDFDYRNLAPNDFMYWELIKYGCDNGYKQFDYGRSKVGTGSYKFKKNWGFEPTPLYYQYHLIKTKELPNYSPANPKYQKKIEMWRKLPLGITKIIGPPISRFLA